jgi:3-methyladenine DNA glycosylase AlkD
MNNYHQEILAQLKKYAGQGTTQSQSDSYLLSGHPYYSIRVPLKRQLAKEWVKEHKDLPFEDYKELLYSLYKGESYEEKTIASIILSAYPKYLSQITPQDIDNWLNELQGWAEIDSLCQGIFPAKIILGNWDGWNKFLTAFAASNQISKRRASLVLLTTPVRQSGDPRLSNLSLQNIEILQLERDILITKAISWLLRDLVKNHRNEVTIFLEKYHDTLPKIALRETVNKLKTGKK